MTGQYSLACGIKAIGRDIRREIGPADVAALKRFKAATSVAQAAGRLVLHFAGGPFAWFCGTSLLGFYLSIEAHLNHSIMHGAYAGLPGAENFKPQSYENIALPFQSRTWGDAHRIHHANPSLVEVDPDTVHPLFRVHSGRPWRPWHALNTFLGAIFTFECWAFDYDRFLKGRGLRLCDDRTEFIKFSLYLGYHFALFPILAGPRWKPVALGSLVAIVMRNLIFTGLQTGSSVGRSVSTSHATRFGLKKGDEWCRFQVETSKNFVLRGFWKAICGGLDRHIEHHLYPNVPPERLYSVSQRVKELCLRHGVLYVEYPNVWASLADSLGHLADLSLPHRMP